jgi:hypothetical protein
MGSPRHDVTETIPRRREPPGRRQKTLRFLPFFAKEFEIFAGLLGLGMFGAVRFFEDQQRPLRTRDCAFTSPFL